MIKITLLLLSISGIGSIGDDMKPVLTQRTKEPPYSAVVAFLSKSQYLFMASKIDVIERKRERCYSDSQLQAYSSTYHVRRKKLENSLKETMRVEYEIRVTPNLEWPDTSIHEYRLEYEMFEGNIIVDRTIRKEPASHIEEMRAAILYSLTNGNGGRHWQYLFHDSDLCRKTIQSAFARCRQDASCYKEKEINEKCNYLKVGTYDPY